MNRSVGRPTMMVGAWKQLADAAGGVVNLATQLGRDRDTVRRWARGKFEPPPEVQAAIGELAASLGVPMPPFGEDAHQAFVKAVGEQNQ